MKRPWQKILLSITALLFSWLFVRHRGRKQLRSNPLPVTNYEDAAKKIAVIQEQEKFFVHTTGSTVLLTQGRKTDTVVVFLHGYTNCPQQFRALGERVFKQGCNVFIPRMPHHGLPEPLTKDHGLLTAVTLTSHADSTIDYARGLGKRIIVAGISAGGTIAGWLALTREDVNRSVLISPVFGYYGFAPLFTKPLMHMMLTMPNFFRWWDEEHKADLPGPRHVYPRYSTRALAALLQLGFEVKRLLRKRSISEVPVTFIINENDTSISNRVINKILRRWKKKNKTGVSDYTFPESDRLEHDLIDPEQVNQNTELVYPVLLDQILKEM